MLNHIVIMGRLTRDPELRRTQSGLPVTSFTVAVDRDVKTQSGERETDFIDCVAWRSTAEFVQKYFFKGSMVVVSGRLQIRDWNDKEGNRRRSAEISVDNMYFGESKRDRDGQSGGYQQQNGGYQQSYQGGYQQGGGYQGGGYQSGGYQSGGSYPQGGYQSGGYQGYSSPVSGSDFAELSDDDGDLPF